MTKHIEPPFMVTLKPSKRLRQLVIAVHWLAMAAAIANALMIVYKVVLIGSVAVHFYYTVKPLNSALCTIKYTDASSWEVGEGGIFESVDILKSTVLTTFAIWLHLKAKPGAAGFFARNKRTILIISDALEEDDYRRLIVKLKTAA